MVKFTSVCWGVLLLFLLQGSLTAQSAAELKTKRQRLLTELTTTTQQLESTKAKKSEAMSHLNLLERQIAQRRELIATLNQEIQLTVDRVATNEDMVSSLSHDLDRMRTEYAQTLRSVYRAQLTQGWLAFVFSANGFNDAFRRVQYLRQYQDYRRRQSRLILQTQQTIAGRTKLLAEQRSEKEELLVAAQEQGGKLEKALASQTSIVDELTGEEKKLLGKVQKQQREQEALDKAIADAIATEIEARKKRESAVARTSSSTNTPPAPVPGGQFSANRGRLPWPAKGSIEKEFGSQPHPDVPSVTIYNGGIDILAGNSATVQAVYDGEVISSRLIPGYRNTIMVRHGDYYTVYSNLDRVIVKVGQEIKGGTTIGYTSPGGEALHFEVWKGKDRQNPKRWLN